MHPITPVRYWGASESLNRNGPTMFLHSMSERLRDLKKMTHPVATPKKTAALAIAFLVWPPTLPDSRESPSTKVALEAPVSPIDSVV